MKAKSDQKSLFCLFRSAKKKRKNLTNAELSGIKINDCESRKHMIVEGDSDTEIEAIGNDQ